MAFESLLFMPRDADSLDVGRLAEALLFYQTVHVTVGAGPLASLVAKVGVRPLIDLLDQSGLTLTYLKNVIGVQHGTDGVIQLGSPRIISAQTLELDEALRRALDPMGARHELQTLADRIRDTGYTLNQLENGAQWFQRKDWIEDCTNRILREYGTKDNFRFRPTRHSHDWFTVDTDIDFDRINQDRPTHLVPLEWRRIYGMTIEACDALERAARANADIETSSQTAIMISTMLSPHANHRPHQREQISSFQQLVFGDGNAIAEAINCGAREFADLVTLLRKAERFRSWLAARAPQVDLAHRFYKEVTRESWVESLPAKAFRWVVGLAVDGCVPAGASEVTKRLIGVAFSGFDTFVLDKLAGGWRPNQFVDGPLRAFSSIDDELSWRKEREDAKRHERNRRKRERRERGRG
jgi:hypothetical protein